MNLLSLLLAALLAAADFATSQSCTSVCPDTQSQLCIAGSCACKSGFQSDQAGGCCPDSLNVTMGVCYKISQMPSSLANCISFCTSAGVGVNLITFPTALSYQTITTMLFLAGAPLGSPFLLGLGKTTSAGPPNWDSTQNWTNYQTKQSPTYTQFSNPNAAGEITYFTFNGATPQDWTIASASYVPTVTYSFNGMSFPLSGYLAICVYYPAAVSTTTTHSVTSTSRTSLLGVTAPITSSTTAVTSSTTTTEVKTTAGA